MALPAWAARAWGCKPAAPPRSMRHSLPGGIARYSHPGSRLQLDIAAAGICVDQFLFWASDVEPGKGARWDLLPCGHRNRANRARVTKIHRRPDCRAQDRQARRWESAGHPKPPEAGGQLQRMLLLHAPITM